MKNSLSICIIAKNEELNIEKSLKSIHSIADEIILVDTGSTDKTKEIAKKYNAKIFDFKWNDDYSKARNESIKYAKSEWILVLDADEELTEEGKKNIKYFLEHISKKNKDKEKTKNNSSSIKNIAEAFRVKVIEPFDGNLNIVYKTVLFKNGKGIKFTRSIHEHITHSNLYVGNADFISIHHFGNLNKTKQELDSKNEKYILKLQKILKDNPKLNDSYFYYYHLGNAYNNKKDYKEALKYYHNAYKTYLKSGLKKKDSFYANILIDLIKNLIFYQEKYDQSQEFIDELISIAPDFPDSYFYQALVLQKFNKYKEAIESYTKANNLLYKPKSNPDDLSLISLNNFYYYSFMTNWGKCYFALNKLDEAFFYFKQAYNSNNILIEARKMIFILYLLEEDLLNAISYYKFEDLKNINKEEFNKLVEISKLLPKDIRYKRTIIFLLESFCIDSNYLNNAEKELVSKYLNILKEKIVDILTVIIVKDAENYIEKTIKLISEFSSNILVIDKDSKDKTKEISSKYSKVIQNKSNNFNWELKNYILENYKEDFILFLEDDESLSLLPKDNVISFLRPFKKEDTALVLSMKKNNLSKINLFSTKYKIRYSSEDNIYSESKELVLIETNFSLLQSSTINV